MVKKFGGKVTGAVSGRTNILIVGQNPGFSKVSKAKAQGSKVQIMSIKDLKAGIEGGKLKEIPAAPAITQFSSGYNGNGLGAYALNGAPPDEMLKLTDLATASSGGGAADPIQAAQAAKKAFKTTKGSVPNSKKRAAAAEATVVSAAAAHAAAAADDDAEDENNGQLENVTCTCPSSTFEFLSFFPLLKLCTLRQRAD